MATGPAPAPSHSFSASTSSKRPRKLTFTELLRSPFRSPTSPDARSPPADWYIPYNGPVEPPRHSTFLTAAPSSSSTSAAAAATTTAFDFPARSTGMPESRSTMTGSVASRRVHKSMNGKTAAATNARQTVLSLDKGGIGESPAAIVPDDYRNHHHFLTSSSASASARRPSAPALFSSTRDTDVSPAAVPYLAPISLSSTSNHPQGSQQQATPTIRVERHPFNPHGFDNYVFPTNTGSTSYSSTASRPATSPGKLTLNLPPSQPLYNLPSPTSNNTRVGGATSPTIERHPYAATNNNSNNFVSRAEQIWPNITGASTATATTSRSFTASAGSDRSGTGLPYTYGSDRTTAGPATAAALSDARGRNQGISGTSGLGLSGSRSTPQNLYVGGVVTPAPITTSPPSYLAASTSGYAYASHPYAHSPALSTIPSSLSGSHAHLQSSSTSPSPIGRPLGYNNKPPIPPKSPGVLHRLRSSTSAPNLNQHIPPSRLFGFGGGAHHAHQGSGTTTTNGPANTLTNTHTGTATTATTNGTVVHDGMAHEYPITLHPTSTIQAISAPRPKFFASLVPPSGDGEGGEGHVPIPGSPYPLAKPEGTESDDDDQNMLAQCLPTIHVPGHRRDGSSSSAGYGRVKTRDSEKEKEGQYFDFGGPPGPSSSAPPQTQARAQSSSSSRARGGSLFASASQPHLRQHAHTPSASTSNAQSRKNSIPDNETDTERRARLAAREDILHKALRDNELLSAEREKWEKHASRGLGSKRSRSLSAQGRGNVVRKSASQGVLRGTVDGSEGPSTVSTGRTWLSGSGSGSASGSGGGSKIMPGGGGTLNRSTLARSRSTTFAADTRARDQSHHPASRSHSHLLSPHNTGPPLSSSAYAQAGSSGGGGSLRYLASAALGLTGRGHAPKVSLDSTYGSGGRSSSNLALPIGGGLVRGSGGGSIGQRSTASGSGTASGGGGHSRGSSLETRNNSVVGLGLVSGRRDKEKELIDLISADDGDVMDIRPTQTGLAEEDSTKAAVDARIGLALSPSPDLGISGTRSRSGSVQQPQTPQIQIQPIIAHPYASRSVAASRAGPHPTQSPSIDATVTFKDDVATRHRLPPQVVHAHKRSVSTSGSNPTGLPTPGASPLMSGISASSPPAPLSAMSDHPFLAPIEVGDRPSSGAVDEAFQEALLASSAASEWPPSLSAELRDDDPDPFRRGPVTIGPSSPPMSPQRTPGTPRKMSNASVIAATPQASPVKSALRRHQQQPSYSPGVPIATSTPIKHARSMSSMSDHTMGRPAPPSSSTNGHAQYQQQSPPVSPTAATFGPSHSRNTSRSHTSRPHLDDQQQHHSGSGATESSVASIVDPEMVIDDSEHDLDEFKDLFYRPQNGYSEEGGLESPNAWRASSEAGGDRPISGSSELWNMLSPVLGQVTDVDSLQDVASGRALSGYSDSANRYRIHSENDSVHVRSIDTSLPSIRPGSHRHSSTPLIEEPARFSNEPRETGPSSLANETRGSNDFLSVAIPRPGSSDALRSASSPSSGGDFSSSNSDDWYRFSRGTMGSRVSGILRGFPTPPDATPPAASLLGSYFPDDLPLASPHLPARAIPSTPELELEHERHTHHGQ